MMAKILEETPNNNQNLGSLDQNSQTTSQTLNTSLNQSSNNSQESQGFFKLPESY